MMACVRIPYFVAGVERRAQPRLRRQALVVGGQPWQAAAVYAVSAESQQVGVQRGQPLRQAYALCPEANFLPTAEAAYRQAVQAVTELLHPFTPLVEPRWTHPAAIYYVDCPPASPPGLRDYVQQLGRTVRAGSGLAPAVGLAPTKSAAYLAARLTPVQHGRLVSAENLLPFLAAIPLARLTLDPALQQRLAQFGLRTLGQLAQLPPDAIRQQFGPAGETLYHIGQGRDPRPIQPPPPALTAAVSLTFDDPVADWTRLEAGLDHLTAQLARQLQAAGQAAGRLRLSLTAPPAAPQSAQAGYALPGQRAAWLAEQARRLLRQCHPPPGVSALRLEAADLQPALAHSLTLFDTPPTGAPGDIRPRLQPRFAGQVWQVAVARAPASPLPEQRYRLTVSA